MTASESPASPAASVDLASHDAPRALLLATQALIRHGELDTLFCPSFLNGLESTSPKKFNHCLARLAHNMTARDETLALVEGHLALQVKKHAQDETPMSPLSITAAKALAVMSLPLTPARETALDVLECAAPSDKIYQAYRSVSLVPRGHARKRPNPAESILRNLWPSRGKGPSHGTYSHGGIDLD